MNKLINFPSLTPELRPAFSRVLKYSRRSATFLAAFFDPRGLRERWTKYNVAAVPDEVVNSSMYPLEWKEKSTRENWKVPDENENWTDTYGRTIWNGLPYFTLPLAAAERERERETVPFAFFHRKIPSLKGKFISRSDWTPKIAMFPFPRLF